MATKNNMEFSYSGEQLSEDVPMQKRLKAGAWLDGESYKEESKATISEANSDHGNFQSAIEKKNA